MEGTYENPPPHTSSSSIDGGISVSAAPQSSSSSASPSSSSSSEVQEGEHHPQQEPQQQQETSISHGVNISISDFASSEMGDDAWSCLVVLVTFWFFAASMTLILGYFGPTNFQFGPNCSHYIYANSLFVKQIKVEELGGPKSGLMLYGLHNHPPLDVVTIWSEMHNASMPANFHKEWIYFLNAGSQVNISYRVRSQSSSPLSLVIAEGKESLVDWIEDPVYPNTTLSWNVIDGNGTIQQDISQSSSYYVAVGNLNSEEAEVQLNIRIRALMYNTTEAYYKCSFSHGECVLKLKFLGKNAAVLTSSRQEQGASSDDWYVKLSYGPQWITYFLGSGAMTLIMLLAFKICHKFQSSGRDRTRFRRGEMRSERAPLLSEKDDDLSSCGSSYDSVSHDEEDIEERLAIAALEGKPPKDGENNNNHRRLCVICFDAQRDCFFLPCGHCAACFTCGTRIAEAGTCPICRRKTKKVKKIFTV